MSREAKILRDALDKIYANAAESPEWIRARLRGGGCKNKVKSHPRNNS